MSALVEGLTWAGVSDDLRRTAQHEWAHALVADMGHLRLDYVTIEERGDTAGHVHFRFRDRPLDEREARNRGSAFVAGAVGERLAGWPATLIEKGASSDRTKALMLAKRYAGSADSPEFRTLLSTLWEGHAETLLRREELAWHIGSLVLAARKTLSRAEVRRIRGICWRQAKWDAAVRAWRTPDRIERRRRFSQAMIEDAA